MRIPSRRRLPAALLAAALLMASAAALANQSRGTDEMSLAGGKRGEVPFPHHRHQEALGDCQMCHKAFPQEVGAIQSLVAQNALKPKQVMNKQCIKCHRARKKAGETTGPLTCGQCHKR
jgi:hypothetical protein